MYQSASAKQKSEPIPAVDPVVARAAEYFAATAKYQPPKVDTFPLHGVGCAGVTSLTGNQ